MPAFPITPQTEIIETLARWCQSGEMATRMVTMDSEHSMLAAAARRRGDGRARFHRDIEPGTCFTDLKCSTPLPVSACRWFWSTCRALSRIRSPWNPTTTTYSRRGIPVFCSFMRNQPGSARLDLDGLPAGRASTGVLLPVIVNLDGFYLSFTREAVDLPALEAVKEFLPHFTPAYPSSFRRGFGRSRRRGARFELVQLLQTSDASRDRQCAGNLSRDRRRIRRTIRPPL